MIELIFIIIECFQYLLIQLIRKLDETVPAKKNRCRQDPEELYFTPKIALMQIN